MWYFTGDIGGSLGLFVGASVISICELLDAFIHNFLKVQFEKSQAKKRKDKKLQSELEQL